jgi:transcriptional regulator with AAA-type ATPase domain
MTHFIYLPPLRERIDDIPLLVEHFVRATCTSMGKQIPEIPDELYGILTAYHYPGNVRELESMIYNVISVYTGKQFPLDLIKKYIVDHLPENGNNIQSICSGEKTEIINIITNNGKLPGFDDVERYLLQKALEKSGGNQSLAAPLLNMTPSTFSRHLKKFGIK